MIRHVAKVQCRRRRSELNYHHTHPTYETMLVSFESISKTMKRTVRRVVLSLAVKTQKRKMK